MRSPKLTKPCISEGRKAKYHYMICGVQGDFTRGLVSNPPTTIWTREMKVRISASSCILPTNGLSSVCRCIEHFYAV